MTIGRTQLACCLGLLLAGVGCNEQPKTSSLNFTPVGPDPITSVLPVGKWGGSDIQLDIQNNGGGYFIFNCGIGGTIPAIIPDENGHFDIAGSYTAFADLNDPGLTSFGTQDVIFHGDVVAADTINVDVEFPNGDAPGGAPMNGFSVMHGTASQVMECQ